MIRSKKNRSDRFDEIQSEKLNTANLLENNFEDIEMYSKTEKILPPMMPFYMGQTPYISLGSLHKTHKITDLGQKELLNEIIEVTETIRETFVEFYELLSETPLFVDQQNRNINTLDFEQYLESLKTQLDHLKRIPALKPIV
ncbi:hypothetical protein [Haliscomenobacter sp.]|uniref:hypothetical protein n=1 Tax=Haliscomenobacter sp. TaxID=2717303 RepID=UPI003BADAE81